LGTRPAACGDPVSSSAFVWTGARGLPKLSATMDGLTLTLALGAAGVAFVHTAIGPDHYLPFVMLGRARRWSLRKTLVITGLCGLGHVASSLGLAAWALFWVGIAYLLFGLRHAHRHRAGLAVHRHGDIVHLHADGEVPHAHEEVEHGERATFWTLLLVFVLGPCEPLIPLFALPASEGDWSAATAAGLVFAVVTIATMLGITAVLLAGVSAVRLGSFERWTHALAGGVVASSAGAVLFLGL
jgi:nickel/cobalt transporter (NicO) family protein